jgi:cytochrome c biogenesis factor
VPLPTQQVSGVEKDIKMSLNETVEIKGYAFTFKGVSALQGANYTGNKDNTISNSKPPHPKTLLRRYKGRGTVMGQSLLQSSAYLSHIGVFQVLKWQ